MSEDRVRATERPVIELSEHDDRGPLDEGRLSEADLDFIEQAVNDDRTRIGISYDRRGRPSISSGSSVGVVSLPEGPTIRVEPKAAAGNLIPLLLFAIGSDVDVIDQPVDVEQDGWFVDAFAGLFLAELDDVLRRGLRQEYVRRESSERHLRGQLNVHRQQQCHPVAPTTFECDFDELTYDTLLNRAVLFATETLAGLVRSEALSSRLSERAGLLRRRVERQPVTAAEVEHIELSRLDEYYGTLLELVELVVGRSFVEGIDAGERRAFSFLIDMNDLYERVVERTVARLCRERSNWTYEAQSRTESLLHGSPVIRMYPDVILRVDGDVAAVLDAKWKTRRSNGDVYQLLAYQSAHEAPGVLVYPQSGGVETSYTVEDGHPLFLVELPTKLPATGPDELAARLAEKLEPVFDEWTS